MGRAAGDGHGRRDSFLAGDRLLPHFLLEAFDSELQCPALQARFEVANPADFTTLLNAPEDEVEKQNVFFELNAAELDLVVKAFSVAFDPSPLRQPRFFLSRLRKGIEAPYLFHTNFELLLLLDGRKKLARMGDAFPPTKFEGEERFDYWVEQGLLYREEVVDLFDKPQEKWLGLRAVYYTLKGEEWRVPAMKLIFRAGGWSEQQERLEGMLFGYEDWQNDWWIEAGRRRGGFGGAPLCCAVTLEGMEWIKAAGFRALPPCSGPTLEIAQYDDYEPERMRAFLMEEPETVALVRFVVPRWPARDILPLSREGARWTVPSHRISELNERLRGAVAIADRRDNPAHPA